MKKVLYTDVNGDTKPDLVVANQGSSNFSVLIGNGTGGFGTATNFSVGASTNPRHIVLRDFNGDGKLDVAVANTGTSNISVFLGAGTGNFGSGTNFATGAGCEGIMAGDFDGDGVLDIATANSGNSTVSVLRGNGMGGFVFIGNHNVGNGPRFLTIGDVNGDQRPDIVSAGSGASSVSVLLNLSQ